MSSTVAIAGVGLCAPGYPNMQTFLSGEVDESTPSPTGELIDKRTRRRATTQTRALADAYAEALGQSGLEPTTVASVFGSALGETGTMIALLDQMWREDSVLSPIRFATSVHNAAGGAVSIATRNKGFTTSLGADHDTPAVALLEAMSLTLAHGLPVLVTCGDEAAPKDMVLNDEGWSSLAVAVAIVPASGAESDRLRISVPAPGEASLAPAEVDRPLAHNPCVGLLDLAVAVGRRQTGRVRLDRGRGQGFVVDLHLP